MPGGRPDRGQGLQVLGCLEVAGHAEVVAEVAVAELVAELAAAAAHLQAVDDLVATVLGDHHAVIARPSWAAVTSSLGAIRKMDAFFWANFPLKPLPERLVG